MLTILQRIQWPGPLGVLEIVLLAVCIYYIIVFFRGTRGAAVLSGFVLFFLLAMLMTHWLRLDALNWLVQRFSVYLAVALVVIFQPEIRRALAELGKQHVFSASAAERSIVEKLVQAITTLAERRIGALLAVEGEIGTRSVQETGTRLDCPLSAELLVTLFFPNTPLHDGGVVVSGGRIMAAGCLFPLSQKDDLPPTLGMRHRAALGLSEETDAVVLVVSEETGVVSVAYKGGLSRQFDEDRLRRFLAKMLLRGRRTRSPLSRVRRELDLTPGGLAKAEGIKTEERASHAG